MYFFSLEKLEELCQIEVSEQNISKQINKMDKNNFTVFIQNQITAMSETKWYLHRISEGTQIRDYQILAEMCNIWLNLPKE